MIETHRVALASRIALCALAGLLLAGCTMTDAATTGSGSARTAFASFENEPTLLVATTRRPAADPGKSPFFGVERGGGLAFARARLVPPDRSLLGRVTAPLGGWSVASVDGSVTNRAAQAFADAALGKDVLLYVHGYRETFETAAISAGELAHGIAFRGAAAIFTWPSGGATLDYGYDRESALWSRDALEALLLALASGPTGGRIHIVAHSMGSQLTLETLRMVRAAGGDAAMARFGAIVFASPDIDIDLFTSGVERLGPDAQKITVISSTKDRALELSRRMAGGVVRAGAADRDKLAALGVRVADASEFGGGLINHDLFLSNADVRGVVKRAIERAR